jgi:cation diffusion facilitator family transporter
MHTHNLQKWEHAHTFGQETKRPGESRTLVVIALTAVTMAAEIAAGLLFGSMALLADGLHMASHATALSINAFAYAYARRHASSPRFSFGTGKVNALGGFTGAVLLATFAVLMAWRSTDRLIRPMHIAFNQAIFVAVLGLVVNGISALILNVRDHRHEHDADPPDGHHQDHNLRSAYLHVMADALTSVLAIAALLSAKYLGLSWMDPAVGIVGAILVARWSVGLLRATSDVLLDRQGPDRISDEIKASIEADRDSRVADLHVWSIGPNTYAAIITVVADKPLSPEEYKARIPRDLGLAHVSIEVCECATCDAGDERARPAPAPGTDGKLGT